MSILIILLVHVTPTPHPCKAPQQQARRRPQTDGQMQRLLETAGRWRRRRRLDKVVVAIRSLARTERLGTHKLL